MNFDFSEDQRLVQERARQVFHGTCPVSTVRSVLEGQALHAEATWRQLGDLGYLGVSIPEEYGGSGLGYLELCLIAEEAGRSLAPIPLSSSIYLAAEALLLAGSTEQKAATLPGIASGERIATASLSRITGVDGVDDRAHLGSGRLTGTKVLVPDGELADLAVLLVEHEAGPSLALVELDQAGVKREAVETIDPTRPHARLAFDGAEAMLLGEAGAGERLIERVRDRAAILVGFEQLGGADAALEMAREYAMTRYAFGRVIGSYQAIKHKLAEVYVKNEIARGHCYYGAWALSTGAGEMPLAAAGVRIAATNAFSFAAQENLQTHGGIGFTWEADCHLYYRRARLQALGLGALEGWKERLVHSIERASAA